MRIRLARYHAEKEAAKRNEQRNSLNKGRVRTYNIITNLVTDHVYGVRLSAASEVLDGNLDLLRRTIVHHSNEHYRS